MSRKTFNVAELIELVNRRLETKSSTLYLEDLTPEQAFRLAAAGLLEEVLHRTDNYVGFRYQSDQKEEDGSLKPDYDHTRRNYYTKGGLT